jgi:hypothetical protein
VRLTLWLAGLIIVGAGVLSVKSLRAGLRRAAAADDGATVDDGAGEAVDEGADAEINS